MKNINEYIPEKWEQLSYYDDLSGKTIKYFYMKSAYELTILFTDNTYIHTDDEYECLTDSHFCTWDIINTATGELTKLGKAFDIDHETLKRDFLENIKANEDAMKKRQYEEYLKLKEQFEGK